MQSRPARLTNHHRAQENLFCSLLLQLLLLPPCCSSLEEYSSLRLYFREKYLFFLFFLLLKGIRFASSFESSALPLSCLTPLDSRERVHILLHLLLVEEEDDQNLSKSSSSSSSLWSKRSGVIFYSNFVSLKNERKRTDK